MIVAGIQMMPVEVAKATAHYCLLALYLEEDHVTLDGQAEIQEQDLASWKSDTRVPNSIILGN